MATWQWALLLLGLVWALQSFGVWLQMRHYRDVMKGVRESQTDGYLGTGYVRGRLSKGTIALVVATEDNVARRVSIMTGRSSLAKFRNRPELEGLSLQSLEARLDGDDGLVDSEKEAVRKAIRQIETFRQKGREESPQLSTARTQNA